MIDIVQLVQKYNREQNINIKTRYAYELLINAFYIIDNDVGVPVDILDNARNFILAVLQNNQAAVLPSDLKIPSVTLTGKDILPEFSVKHKVHLSSSISIGMHLALITNRNQDVLLWKIIGSQRVCTELQGRSEEDLSASIVEKIGKFNKDIKSHLSLDVLNFLNLIKVDAEKQQKTHGLLLAFGAPADNHRIWDHNRILACIILGESSKLQLQQIDSHKVVYCLLLLQCIELKPIVVFGLFDFVLQLSVLALPKDLTNSIHQYLLDLLWYRLALMFWELKDRLENTHKKELIYYGFELCYLEYFFPVMAIFCAKNIHKDNFFLLEKLNIPLRNTMDSLIESQIFLVPSMNFLTVMLDTSPEYPKKYLDHVSKRTLKYSPGYIRSFSIFGYLKDFIQYITEAKSSTVVGLICSRLSSFSIDSAVLQSSLQIKEKLLVQSTGDLVACRQQISEQISLSVSYQAQLEGLIELRGQHERQKKQIETLEQTKAEHQHYIARFTSVLDEKYQHITRLLCELEDLYGNFNGNNGTDVLVKLELLKKKIIVFHLLAYAYTDNSQVNFNIIFCKYLILIYKIFNSVFDFILINLESVEQNKKLHRYITTVKTSLLNYDRSIKLLGKYLQELESDLQYSQDLTQLNLLYRYIIVVGTNLSENRSKVTCSQEELNLLLILQEISDYFAENKLSIITTNQPLTLRLGSP